MVDDEDYEKFGKFSWYFHTTGHGVAVRRTPEKKGKVERIYLHRAILKAGKGIHVDHINGNTLDNRKQNLRLCSIAENNRNVGKRKNNISGYKGVFLNKKISKWFAQVSFEKKGIYLGSFSSKKDAARAYNRAAIKYFGKFAQLNQL